MGLGPKRELCSIMYFLLVKHTPFYLYLDGMAYRDSYISWIDKSQSECKKMMESFADKCRNEKVVWSAVIFTFNDCKIYKGK